MSSFCCLDLAANFSEDSHHTCTHFHILHSPPLCACVLGQEEETPLHCAAWHGYYPVAKALCEAGCNVNIKNREGETPLLTASARGYHDIVECVAEHGADLNASDKVLRGRIHHTHREVIWGARGATRFLNYLT